MQPLNRRHAASAMRRSARCVACNAAKLWQRRIVTRGAVLGLTTLAAACAQQQGPVPAVIAVQSVETAPDAPREAETRPVTMRAPAMQPAGRAQLGKASYYGPEFAGRTMANGRRFDPRSNTVAHRTLPLGTRVLVRNLDNGRVTTATVEDRGPYIRGRIIDVSPLLAERLGMLREGVVPVEVLPLEVAEAP
jgi:rare lipoprotein A